MPDSILPMLDSLQLLDPGQAVISCTRTVMISVIESSLFLSFSGLMLSSSVQFPPLSSIALLRFVQRAELQKPKMTLNRLRGSTEITV